MLAASFGSKQLGGPLGHDPCCGGRQLVVVALVPGGSAGAGEVMTEQLLLAGPVGDPAQPVDPGALGNPECGMQGEPAPVVRRSTPVVRKLSGCNS